MQPLVFDVIRPVEATATAFVSASAETPKDDKGYPQNFEETLRQTKEANETNQEFPSASLGEIQDEENVSHYRSPTKDSDILNDPNTLPKKERENSADNHMMAFSTQLTESSKTTLRDISSGFSNTLDTPQNMKATATAEISTLDYNSKSSAQNTLPNRKVLELNVQNAGANNVEPEQIDQIRIHPTRSTKDLTKYQGSNPDRIISLLEKETSRGISSNIEKAKTILGTDSVETKELPPSQNGEKRSETSLHLGIQRETSSFTASNNPQATLEQVSNLDTRSLDSKDTSPFRIDSSQDTKLITPQTQLSAAPKPELTAPITRQITDSIQARMVAEKTIEVSLNPTELGRLKLSLSPAENGLVINILAERAETLEIIKRNIQDLEQIFAEQGHENLEFSFDQNKKPFDKENDRNSEHHFGSTDQAEDNRTPPTKQDRATQVAGNTSGIDMRV
jgi:hypothetical protein